MMKPNLPLCNPGLCNCLNFTLVVDPASDGPAVLHRLHPLGLVVLVVDAARLVNLLLADVLPLPPAPANRLILDSGSTFFIEGLALKPPTVNKSIHLGTTNCESLYF